MKAKAQKKNSDTKQKAQSTQRFPFLIVVILLAVGLFGLYVVSLSFEAWANYKTSIPASQFCTEVLSNKNDVSTCIASVFENIDSNRTYAQIYAITGGALGGISLTGLVAMLFNKRAVQQPQKK